VSAAPRIVGFIPARLGSTRFPGKVLAAETGKPLIQHVFEAARRAGSLTRLVIATDDQRVMAAASAFGAEAVLTGVHHPNGTSRIAEAATLCGLSADDVVVNVQGDEPELDPAIIDAAVDSLLSLETSRGAVIGTVAAPLGPEDRAADPNIVKVVRDIHGCAMYFSRSCIPFDRDARGGADAAVLRHIGIYAYRRGFLDTYLAMSPTPLERAEQLEQLRVLQNGYRIGVGLVAAAHAGIDTAEQYQAFVRRHASRS